MKKTLLFLVLLGTSLVSSQVRQVKDINSGPTSSSIREFTVYAGKIFFSADDGINNPEFWATDGTNAGTEMVKDINTVNALGSNPNNLTLANDLLFFSAYDGVGSTPQLFVSAGNGATTIKLTTNLLSSPDNLFGTATNLYFVGRDEVLAGRELWKSDGLSSGTGMVIDLTPGGGQNSEVNYFGEFNNKIYFGAITTLQGNPNPGIELFSSDGTAAGTQFVVDINPGTAHGDPRGLFVFNNKLFFTANHIDFGREMFSVTTTGTLQLLKDIQVGAMGGSPSEMHIHNGAIYFSANDGINNNGQELWISDGFPNGTQLLKDINPATVGPLISSNPRNFTSLGNDLFFVAMDNVNGNELWKTDGTSAGTIMVKDISTTGSSNPENLTIYNGKLYFTAQSTSSLRELWVSDGTEAGTQMITNLEMGNEMVVFNNELYFTANDGIDGEELWAYQDPALSINDIDNDEIQLLPNPVTNNFEIRTNNVIQNIQVVNINGQIVKRFNESMLNYNIEDLESGLYFIKVSTGLGERTFKVIKQ